MNIRMRFNPCASENFKVSCAIDPSSIVQRSIFNPVDDAALVRRRDVKLTLMCIIRLAASDAGKITATVGAEENGSKVRFGWVSGADEFHASAGSNARTPVHLSADEGRVGGGLRSEVQLDLIGHGS